jgi:hypothetical protein
MRYALLILILLMVGCAKPDPIIRYHTIEVKVPVQIKAEPPEALRTPPLLEAPTFVPPSDPAASSALTKEGEQQLKRLLLQLRNRERAWRAWGG